MSTCENCQRCSAEIIAAEISKTEDLFENSEAGKMSENLPSKKIARKPSFFKRIMSNKDSKSESKSDNFKTESTEKNMNEESVTESIKDISKTESYIKGFITGSNSENSEKTEITISVSEAENVENSKVDLAKDNIETESISTDKENSKQSPKRKSSFFKKKVPKTFETKNDNKEVNTSKVVENPTTNEENALTCCEKFKLNSNQKYEAVTDKVVGQLENSEAKESSKIESEKATIGRNQKSPKSKGLFFKKKISKTVETKNDIIEENTSEAEVNNNTNKDDVNSLTCCESCKLNSNKKTEAVTDEILEQSENIEAKDSSKIESEGKKKTYKTKNFFLFKVVQVPKKSSNNTISEESLKNSLNNIERKITVAESQVYCSETQKSDVSENLSVKCCESCKLNSDQKMAEVASLVEELNAKNDENSMAKNPTVENTKATKRNSFFKIFF